MKKQRGKNMAFQKGKSGNPNGRPKKGNTFTDILENILLERTGEIQTIDGKKTVHGKEVLANVLYEIAADTNNAPKIRLDAINIIMDRIDGKPTQKETIQANINAPQNELYNMTAEERLAEFHKLMGYENETT